MQRSIIDASYNVLKFSSLKMEINTRGRSAGDGVSGNGQVVYGNQPRWEGTLNVILTDADAVRAWSAILSKLRGRVNLLRMRMIDKYGVNFADMGVPGGSSEQYPIRSTYGDGATFGDGSKFATFPVLYATSAISAGDTSFTADGTTVGDALTAGQRISVDGWMYRVTGIGGTAAARTYTVEPPFRRAHATTAPIQLFPEVIVALESDDAGAVELEPSLPARFEYRVLEWVSRS